MPWISRRWIIPAALAFWAILAGISLQRSLADLDAHAYSIAAERARMIFSLVETFRLWNARHGGVYVPMTAETPANDWLEVKHRDVEVAGRPFTMVNPAYMTRQVGELLARQSEMRLHITSLRPIRPDNAPDPWEARVLARFDRGEREVIELDNGGDPMFRYMAPLPVREACLGCHAHQGYKLGEVRGGISVSLPARSIVAEVAPQRRNAILLHATAFLALALLSAVALRQARDSWNQLAAAKAVQDDLVADRTAHLLAANEALQREMQERQRMAVKLEQTVGEIQRSNTALEQFAYVVSHDLQEPLRMVNGYAQLLRRRYGDALQGDGQDFLGFLVDGAQRMNSMVADLLAYSRVQRQPHAPQPEDGEALLAAALDNLKAAIAEAGATVGHDPLPTLRVDAGQFVRLLQNLIGNAIKYRAADRPPAIHLGVGRQAEVWHFTVRDNGIGIAAEFLDRVFLVFQRLHSRADYPGNGIGLAICQTIVERHGGRIWVESAPGEGSVFHFTIPAAEEGRAIG